jgi:hypothetical protein
MSGLRQGSNRSHRSIGSTSYIEVVFITNE